MPLYEYECGSCGTRFERIQKFSDPPVTVCPNCASDAVKRLISSPAIQFKGSGFYITDYTKSGQPPAEGSSDKADASKGDKPGAQSTSEPAGKSDSASKPAPATSESKTSTAPAKPAGTSGDQN